MNNKIRTDKVSRQKRAAACFIFLQLLEELTENEPRERWWRKQLTEEVSWTYDALGQTGKTITNYHEEFEHAQRDS